MTDTETAAVAGRAGLHPRHHGHFSASAMAQISVTRFFFFQNPIEPPVVGGAEWICLSISVLRGNLAVAAGVHWWMPNPTKAGCQTSVARRSPRSTLGSGNNPISASDYFSEDSRQQPSSIMAKASCDDGAPPEGDAGRTTDPPSPGQDSPSRENSSISRGRRSTSGACKAASSANGARVLRARIDMSVSNINLREMRLCISMPTPVPRTARRGGVYPSYDLAMASQKRDRRISFIRSAH